VGRKTLDSNEARANMKWRGLHNKELCHLCRSSGIVTIEPFSECPASPKMQFLLLKELSRSSIY
jgi:hypothetical protein